MGTQKTFRMNNLGGGINLTSEDNALETFDYNGAGVQAEAREQENWANISRGGLRPPLGFSLFKAVGANPITGLYRFIRSGGSSHFIVTSGTLLQTLSGGTLTTVYSSLTNNALISFETALDRLVFCDGTILPQQWDGTTVTALTTGADATAITGARQAVFYQNRLWVFNATNNPSLLYFSNAGVINAGYFSNFVQCDVNDGQRIVCVQPYFIPGSLRPVLLVGKERSVGIVSGTGTVADPYSFSKINFDAGLLSFRGAVQFAQDFAYLTPKGVSTMQTDSQFGGIVYEYLSEKVRTAFTSMNAASSGNAHCFYDWKNARLGFAIPESGQTWPKVIWFYDTRLGSWYKERWGGTHDATATLIDSDGTWYHGDSQGNLWAHNANILAFGNNVISSTYTTAYLDFGAPNLYKRIIAARATIRNNGNASVGVSSKLDYGERIGSAHTLQAGSSAYIWGGGTWTNNPGIYQWGAVPIRTIKFFPSGLFRSIQFTFVQSLLNTTADLFELSFDVEFQNLL